MFSNWQNNNKPATKAVISEILVHRDLWWWYVFSHGVAAVGSVRTIDTAHCNSNVGGE